MQALQNEAEVKQNGETYADKQSVFRIWIQH